MTILVLFFSSRCKHLTVFTKVQLWRTDFKSPVRLTKGPPILVICFKEVKEVSNNP